MTTYMIAVGQRASHANALAAGTADTVTFAGNPRGGGFRSAEIANHPGGTGIIYACADGTTATVAGSNCVVVFPGQAVVLDAPQRGSSAVSLISAGTPTYSVTEV